MKKNTWCLLLLIIPFPYLPLASQERDSWWQSRTNVEKGFIVAASVLAATVMVGAGVKKAFFHSAKKRSKKSVTKQLTKPLADFSLFTQEREECYLLLPKAKSLFSKASLHTSTTKTANKVFLINERGGNVKYHQLKEEVDIIPLNIAFLPNGKQISVLEECFPDPDRLIFLKGETADIEKEKAGKGDEICIFSKKLVYGGGELSNNEDVAVPQKINVPSKIEYLPCIRVNGYYIIVPPLFSRIFEK